MTHKDKPHPCASTFDNLINGNLTDAKRKARRHKQFTLYRYALDELGWQDGRAIKAAAYLKNNLPFQDYCDSK